MGRDETLARLVKLLGCLPGVRVDWAYTKPDRTCIGMLIDSPESLALLACTGVHANTPSLRVTPTGVRYDPRDIRYVLDVPEPPDEVRRHTPLKIFGIFLAGDLKERGLIPVEEAEEMRKAWNEKVL